MANGVQAKRVASANLPPIESPTCRYEHQHAPLTNKQAGFGMHVLCISNDTGKPLWDTEIYTVTFDAHMETDVQEIELASFALKSKFFAPNSKRIVAKDENGTEYKLNAQDGTLILPSTAKHY